MTWRIPTHVAYSMYSENDTECSDWLTAFNHEWNTPEILNENGRHHVLSEKKETF